MSLLDSARHRSGVLELCAPRCLLPLDPSIRRRSNRLCCYAMVPVDDDEQKQVTTRKRFSIRVPTIPNFGDIESARRMLESAFHSLSFEMPKLPIDSALQGLTFDIFKLSIPKRVLVFDITGFVATKLKKQPRKDVEDAALLEEGLYPRCAWPRTSKEAHVEEVLSIGTLRDQESGVNLVLEQNTAAYPHTIGLHTTDRSDLSNEAKLDKRPFVASSLSAGTASFKAPVGPHCAWPRKTHQFRNEDGVLSALRGVRYPHSAWPRKSLSGDGVVLGCQQSLVELNMGSTKRKEEVSPCVIEGGARCAWPRKTVSAKQNCRAETTTTDFNGAAELPRRMLATSVGLSLMNQLVKGSIVTSLFDFCSLLPAGPLEIAEEEDAALDLGRRTLLVFIRHSAG